MDLASCSVGIEPLCATCLMYAVFVVIVKFKFFAYTVSDLLVSDQEYDSVPFRVIFSDEKPNLVAKALASA